MTAPRPRPARAPRPAALALTAALVAGLSACAPPGGRPAGPANDLDAAPPKTTTLTVTAVRARSGTLGVQRSVSATIEAQRDSQVAAQSGGTVRAVLAAEGERVAAGQVVVQLDDTPARQAVQNARLQLQQAQITLDQTRDTTGQATGALEASVASARASLAQAQSGARSAESLYALGGISLADVQAARAQLAQAQSALAQAQNTLAQNGRSAQSSVPLQQANVQTAAAAVAQAEENLARTAVRAPFAGIVASVGVEVGEFAAQGSAVFRLVDPGSIRATFSVPSGDAAALAEGARVNLGYAGVNYVGVVTGSPGIAGSNRLVPVTARVQGGEALPVGATAQARYRTTLGSGVLLPSAAVQVEEGRNTVYVAAGGRAEQTPVTVIAESAGQVAVSGVQPGAQVIAPVPASLQDGAAVTVKAAGGSAAP